MDSEADIEKCIERATELGLKAYAITDHCECNAWYGEEYYTDEQKRVMDYFGYEKDFNNSVSAVTELKSKYSDKINLICGTELGQAHHNTEIAEKAVSDKRLDFVIGSVHQIRGEKDFYYIDYKQMTMDEIYRLLERYFIEVHELCRWGKFDVLAHLTYCLRYMKCRDGISADLRRFDDIIAEIFRELALNGKGIEINTSGIRQGFGSTFPDLKYVKMFRDLGGEIISVGSDAHTAEDIGADISVGIETASRAGFESLCFFKNRQPYFLEIDS